MGPVGDFLDIYILLASKTYILLCIYIYIMILALHTYVYTVYVCIYIYMPWAPQGPYMFIRCFMVNSLVFGWPIPLISFHGWKGAHVFFSCPLCSCGHVSPR